MAELSKSNILKHILNNNSILGKIELYESTIGSNNPNPKKIVNLIYKI